MNNCYANILAGTSALIQKGEELIEVTFRRGKPGLQDLVVFLMLCGWQMSSPLLFMSLNAEDTVFMVASDNEVLAIMSKELCELFQGHHDCDFLAYEEIVEMCEQAGV